MKPAVGRRLLIAGVGALALGASVAGAYASAPASTMPVPVDRQDYVTASTTTNPSDGSTIDAYDSDPSSIHVAIQGGQEFARSFVHLALSYLPDGTRATGAVLTLHLTAQSDASSSGAYPIYNVNPTAAIVQACVLTSELAATFDYQHPPAYDCAHGSAVGKVNTAGDTWTFDLHDLVAYWNQHGNTGAALIPVGSGEPGQTWAVAFYKSRSSAVISYTATATATTTTPAVAGGGSGGAAGQRAAGTTGSMPGALPALLPAVQEVPASVATPAVAGTPAGAPTAAAPAPQVATRPATIHHGGVPAWPWVLLGCFAVAAGSLGFAHRERLLALVQPSVAVFRAHPRAYAVAATAVVWGLIFTGYSVVNSSATGAESLANGIGSGASTSNGGTAAVGTTQPGNSPAAAATGNSPTSGSMRGQLTSTVQGTGNRGGEPQTATDEFAGPGSYRMINGVRVFFPADGSPPVADLYHGADDTIGITANQIELCAHAALTYGSAFNISASDLNVYWNWLNDHGGIFGRKVHGDYENDNYDPGTAVQAAQACKDLKTFMLLGGIGFDQIPAVRQWAEQNHELYLHHIATIQNTAGLRYSFSSQPTVEQVGQWFGQLAVQQFHGQKIGILYRNSSNWSPGVDAFEQVLKAAGMSYVSYPVTINQGNYTQELAQLNTAGVKVVWAWENALAEVEMIKQAQGQDYHPAWLVFPFNLETNTLGSSSLDQQLWGISTWDPYDPNYYGGGFAGYAAYIHEFEAQYHQYDPNASLTGDGGDLLFLNWEAQRQIADLLQVCGPQCTRNKIAGILLAGYRRPVPPACDVNFARTGDHHHGGYLFDVVHVVNDPNGRPNFVPVQRCITGIG